MSEAAAAESKRARTLTGVVVNAGADKTVRVRVERRVRHPRYGKTVRRSNDILAHDADNAYAVGDVVTIAECRPISKNKAWRVAGKAGKGS